MTKSTSIRKLGADSSKLSMRNVKLYNHKVGHRNGSLEANSDRIGHFVGAPGWLSR